MSENVSKCCSAPLVVESADGGTKFNRCTKCQQSSDPIGENVELLPQMDWGQVVLNGGPPCFFVEGPQFCGRAERWQGHGNPAFHNFISFKDFMRLTLSRVTITDGGEGRHPEDYCHKCRRPNISWSAPSLLWNEFVRAKGEPEIICPICFVKLAAESGFDKTWDIVPDSLSSDYDERLARRAAKRITTATIQTEEEFAVIVRDALMQSAAALAKNADHRYQAGLSEAAGSIVNEASKVGQLMNAADRDGFVRGYEQARADAARIVRVAGNEWGDKARERKSKTYSAYVIAALDIEGRIRALAPL